MDEAERQSLEAELQEQLQQEHQERLAKTGTRARRGVNRSEEYERMVVAKELRERFYEEHGYVRYTNSRGETEWLLPDEAERRQKSRRRRRKSRKKHSAQAPVDREPFSGRTWALLAAAALFLSVFLGYFVLRG
ncbi:MAG: hypothetical protein H6746_21065 [Deltaproteobacteria bacterium]|nr:hypothetical protein [Deltaproteobacteria bacterium]